MKRPDALDREFETELFSNGHFYCPLCEKYVARNPRVSRSNLQPEVGWLPNMVVHYRHNHSTYYDRIARKIRTERGHRNFRHLVNERIRRQIIRKCWRFMRHHGIGAEHFEKLPGVGRKTIALARKKLSDSSVRRGKKGK